MVACAYKIRFACHDMHPDNPEIGQKFPRKWPAGCFWPEASLLSCPHFGQANTRPSRLFKINGEGTRKLTMRASEQDKEHRLTAARASGLLDGAKTHRRKVDFLLLLHGTCPRSAL